MILDDDVDEKHFEAEAEMKPLRLSQDQYFSLEAVALTNPARQCVLVYFDWQQPQQTGSLHRLNALNATQFR